LHGHTLTLYHLLQYGSSVVGLMVVIGALVLWLRHAPAPPQRPRRRLGRGERFCWAGLYFVLPLLGLALVTWHVLGLSPAALPTGMKLEGIAIMGMRASAVSLVFVSLLLRARLALVRQAPPS
jgi:hypothetical protein